MRKIIFIFACICVFLPNLYSENTSSQIFKSYDTDKYYMGFQDPRAFITRLFFNKNFDIEDTLKTSSGNKNWNFDTVLGNADCRLATEVPFYRNEYFAVGLAGSMEALILADVLGEDNFRFLVYDFAGEFAPYIDLWLNPLFGLDMKVRIYPVFHKSTHYVDGFESATSMSDIKKAASYEFVAINTYYYNEPLNITVYGGLEFTWHSWPVDGTPFFRGHVGLDYRLPILSEHDINFIAGINIAIIYDYECEDSLMEEQWHPAVNVAAGIEFNRYALSLKYAYQRGRGATTYFTEQSSLGAEFSILF